MVMDIVQTAVVAIALFVATNLDDIFILVSFYAGGRVSAREVTAGQYLGMAILVAVSLIAALIALVIPAAWIGLLGLLPIAIGVKMLFDRDDDDDEEAAVTGPGSGLARMASVAAVTVANGGDNIGVYTPLFATQPLAATAVTLGVFAVMTGLWCLAGYWLVHHPKIGAPIRKWGPRLTPFVLIALGLLILYEADTLSLLSGA